MAGSSISSMRPAPRPTIRAVHWCRAARRPAAQRQQGRRPAESGGRLPVCRSGRGQRRRRIRRQRRQPDPAAYLPVPAARRRRSRRHRRQLALLSTRLELPAPAAPAWRRAMSRCAGPRPVLPGCAARPNTTGATGRVRLRYLPSCPVSARSREHGRSPRARRCAARGYAARAKPADPAEPKLVRSGMPAPCTQERDRPVSAWMPRHRFPLGCSQRDVTQVFCRWSAARPRLALRPADDDDWAVRLMNAVLAD